MGKESNIWYFEDTDLFSIFCPHKVKDKVGDEHEFIDYKKGDYIYFPEETASDIYLIASGRIKIGTYASEGKEIIKGVLGKGEIFGEMAIFGESERKDFAQVLDAGTSICKLGLDDMNELMKNNRALSIKMTRLIGLKLQRAENRIESLIYKDAKTRVIEFLLKLGREKGKKVGFETLVNGFFTHQDIASLTATSRQTVTTFLNELREQNLISFNRKRLLIRDMENLEAELEKTDS